MVVTNEKEMTEKAGGIIVRENKQGVREICLIHRRRHDDWSVPKGHIEEGENPTQAAIREVGEETGFYCTVGDLLPPFFYITPAGEHVVVHFFIMQVLEEGLDKDGEVDQLEWFNLESAVKKVSYNSLADYLKEIF